MKHATTPKHILWQRLIRTTAASLALACGGVSAQSLESPAFEALHSGDELNSVAYGNGVYAAVGASGSILVSADAEVWRKVDLATNLAFNAVAFAEGAFVAVGEAGAILVSETAAEWETRASGTAEALLDITHGDGKFIAVGEAGVMLESETTAEWETKTSGTTKAIVSIAQGTTAN